MRETTFSPCRQYRYTLWRLWDFEYGENTRGEVQPPYAMFIGLNPSTADETKDDPTIRRCIAFAKQWGYGALCMTNLFAFRATSPKVMKQQDNPAGIDNQHHLLQCGSKAGIIVAAWGTNGSHQNRDLTVQDWLHKIGLTLHCLRTTKHGFPEHPLYVPRNTKPIPYTPTK